MKGEGAGGWGVDRQWVPQAALPKVLNEASGGYLPSLWHSRKLVVANGSGKMVRYAPEVKGESAMHVRALTDTCLGGGAVVIGARSATSTLMW
jgi:hypothetical protein